MSGVDRKTSAFTQSAEPYEKTFVDRRTVMNSRQIFRKVHFHIEQNDLFPRIRPFPRRPKARRREGMLFSPALVLILRILSIAAVRAGVWPLAMKRS